MKPSDSSDDSLIKEFEKRGGSTLNRSETQNRLIKMQMRKAMKMAASVGSGGHSTNHRNDRTLTYKMSTV
jgi:hypothetical protein